jgi:hypothetical protein
MKFQAEPFTDHSSKESAHRVRLPPSRLHDGGDGCPLRAGKHSDNSRAHSRCVSRVTALRRSRSMKPLFRGTIRPPAKPPLVPDRQLGRRADCSAEASRAPSPRKPHTATNAGGAEIPRAPLGALRAGTVTLHVQPRARRSRAISIRVFTRKAF